MDINIIDIIVLLSMGFIYYTMKNLLPSYFSQKGKNLAQQEDIALLTEKVEEVKVKFIERTETLKARLDIFTQLQIGHKNEERNAIIRFHEAMFSWINMCLDSGQGGVDDYNNEAIDQRIFTVDNTYQKVLNTQSLLELYMLDLEFINSIHDLKIAVLENLSKHSKNCLFSLKVTNIEIKSLEIIENHEERLAKQKEILDKRENIYKEFRSNILTGYKQVLDQIRDFQKATRAYLQQLTEDDK